MADLKTNFAGIDSPNPFWLASAPPTNMDSMIERAFDAGWGGAVEEDSRQISRNYAKNNSEPLSISINSSRCFSTASIIADTNRFSRTSQSPSTRQPEAFL
jgi:dihydroorotate dehydrogenase